MAIVVKHGLAPSTALSGFGEGVAKRAVDTARFTAPKKQTSSGGGRKPLEKKREIPEKKATPIMAPQLIGMRQPKTSFVRTGNAQDKAFATMDGEFNRQNEAVNASAWERYRSKMMQGGYGDPGKMPSSGYAPRVSGGSSAPSPQQQEAAPAERYSQKQIQDYNAMSDAYEDAVKSNNFTPEELVNLEREMIKQKMGIKDSGAGDRLSNPDLPLQEQFAQQTITDEAGNRFAQKDGTWQKLADAAEPVDPVTSVMDRLGRVAAVRKLYGDNWRAANATMEETGDLDVNSFVMPEEPKFPMDQKPTDPKSMGYKADLKRYNAVMDTYKQAKDEYDAAVKERAALSGAPDVGEIAAPESATKVQKKISVSADQWVKDFFGIGGNGDDSSVDATTGAAPKVKKDDDFGALWGSAR